MRPWPASSTPTRRRPRRTDATIIGIADLGQAVALPKGVPWFPDEASVRWVLLHLVEETARHAGHADIIRECLDGATSSPLMAAAEGWEPTPWVTPWDAGRVMNEIDVFQLADRTLNGVVAQIADDQWDMVMPATFLTRRSDTIPTTARGRRLPRLRRRLGARHVGRAARWRRSGRTSSTATSSAPTRGRPSPPSSTPPAPRPGRSVISSAAVHCSFGDYPVREYLWQINGFRGLRAHDIAEVIGVDSRLPDDLVQGLWDEIHPHAEEWRTIGVFPAAVPVGDDAPLQDRLLGLTGRTP